MKTCKQCGDMKPQDQFRKYYQGRKGTFTTCKDCERINNRYKYLQGKGESMNYDEESEVYKIEQLWDAQRKLGLQPPRIGQGRSAAAPLNLDDALTRYTKSVQTSEVQQHHNAGHPTPEELNKWLSEPLTEEPDFYLDDVYEMLKKKYRPTIRIDGTTMLPVYDETYKTVLDQILERFYKYEDDYES